jgi:hypothetical protein
MDRDRRNVLVVGFWGVSDPLTHSTLFPTITLLLRAGHATKVWLATVERGASVDRPEGLVNVVHVPLVSWRKGPALIGRSLDLFCMPIKLLRLARRERIACIVARSTMAGALAYPASRLLGIPLVVESLEPHADYMVECGEWSRSGPFATMTRLLERVQLRHAHRLLSVTENYKRRLVSEGIREDRILVVPCPVEIGSFAFSAADRREVRQRLGWDNELVGVYLGKFGGLYHREQAFKVFVDSHRFFSPNFKLMILTSENAETVKGHLERAGFPLGDAFIAHVDHEDVPAYLSTADLAFSLYKGTASSAFLSPVKNGEYWCNGLPVLLTRGVSDDSALIASDPLGGALFDPEGDDLKEALRRISQVLSTPDQRERTSEFGKQARSPLKLSNAYEEVFSSLATKDRRSRP